MRPRPGQGIEGAKDDAWCKFFFANPRRQVNLSGLLFHVQPLSGLALAGGWCDRLIIWLPLLDMAARVLRDAVGGRV
jgi:hypothetical protein